MSPDIKALAAAFATGVRTATGPIQPSLVILGAEVAGLACRPRAAASRGRIMTRTIFSAVLAAALMASPLQLLAPSALA